MIHIRIDKNHTTAIDISVNTSMASFTCSTPKNDLLSPIISKHCFTNRKQHTYNYVGVKSSSNSKVNYLTDKKIYSPQQIFHNVETIQKQYEQTLQTPIKSSTSSCSSLRKMINSIKRFNFLRNKTTIRTQKVTEAENRSPFSFGGNTLQWITLPRRNDWIYENEFLH